MSDLAALYNRNTLINYCIVRFGFERYLEIGCKNDGTFSKVLAKHKVGVDPLKGGTIRLTSDQFFASIDDTFDIILIDGLHHCEQVARDIEHSLACLRPGGVIMLHDCNPIHEPHQRREPVEPTWNGDVWKAFVNYRQDQRLDMIVGDFDHGIGLIRVRRNSSAIRLEVPYPELNWHDLEANRAQWLRLSTAEEVKEWL